MMFGHSMSNSRFIVTEKFPQSGLGAEGKVWKSLSKAFTDDNCLAYWRYPLFSSIGEKRKEPDILMLHQTAGVVIIEVKALKIDQIHSMEGHLWRYNDFYEDCGNPYEQAEAHLFSFLSMSDRYPELRRRVQGRAIVALPNITRRQWEQKGFHLSPCSPPVLFKDDLGDGCRETILNAALVQSGQSLDDGKWTRLCNVAGNTSVLKPVVQSSHEQSVTKADAIAKAREVLLRLDMEQETAAKQIPDGPQRIRGIAGSGKTVLLCQKAAQMHLKNPEWDIALVFFTRSLYGSIIDLLDRYIRQFTGGERGYNPDTSRLRVLHAWGAKDQPGLYGEVCNTVGCRKLTPREVSPGSPSAKLSLAINQMRDWLGRSKKTIPPLFDAILIDEGQDLVVDEEYQDKGVQPFYWMAYNFCRPVEQQETSDLFAGEDESNTVVKQDMRRLIWAYDEAQCLESPIIPTAREVFGAEHSNMLQGQYEGGIKRSIVMHRCYRTPGPILTAAHAIGMGLLREEGMISGVTTQKDWQDLGYEVSGRFVKNGSISLQRPEENSPNPIPSNSSHPTLEMKFYSDRQQEAEAVAENIAQDIKTQKLTPECQLLVVVFDRGSEQAITSALQAKGINFYIPSEPDANTRQSKWPVKKPNKFWHKGAVTVSQIHRAKGNEAEMVYVPGLDLIADDEASLAARNKLFVAMTRAKGWVHISGVVRHTPFYDELKTVIEAKGRYNFQFKKAPQRDLSDRDLPPEWAAVTSELKNNYHSLIHDIAGTIAVPDVDKELVEGKNTIARPLLSWPKQKIAITANRRQLFKQNGWQVFVYADVAKAPASFVKTVREAI